MPKEIPPTTCSNDSMMPHRPPELSLLDTLPHGSICLPTAIWWQRLPTLSTGSASLRHCPLRQTYSRKSGNYFETRRAEYCLCWQPYRKAIGFGYCGNDKRNNGQLHIRVVYGNYCFRGSFFATGLGNIQPGGW